MTQQKQPLPRDPARLLFFRLAAVLAGFIVSAVAVFLMLLLVKAVFSGGLW